MEHKFQIQTKIQCEAANVFEAIRNPELLCRYFARSASGPLTEGALVEWQLEDEHGASVAVPVRVRSVSLNKRICFTWAAQEIHESDTPAPRAQAAGYDTTVEITLDAVRPGQTLVRITEGVWASTEEGLQGSYRRCQDWMQMACSLKAFLEQGIDLRRPTA